jgi:hypothetical protein
VKKIEDVENISAKAVKQLVQGVRFYKVLATN